MPASFKNPPKLVFATNPLASQARVMLTQAIALHQQGRLTEAKAMYEGILNFQPGNAEALHLSGVLAAQTQHHKTAVKLITKAISINPRNAFYHGNLGNTRRELGQPMEALASFDKAIALKPDYAEAYSNRGIVLHAVNQLEAAVASYDRAIAIRPGFAEAYSNRGLALQALGHLAAALADYDRAISIRPDYAEAHTNRGAALQKLKDHHAAIASYETAIALRPDDAKAHTNRGVALQELGHLDAALASHDRAIKLRPDFAEAHLNRGTALQGLLQLDAAAASFEKAISLDSGLADAYWNLSCTLLLQGDFERGWPLHEWRWSSPSTLLAQRHFTQPLWLGKESIEGKTLLLHSEQGLGDVIQFCRYVAPLAAAGARVIAAVPDPLLALLQGVEGLSALVSMDAVLPAFDFHCPMLSLPLALKTTLTTIPGSRGYLHADNDRLERWAHRLGARDRPRIGLVWSGNSAHKNDHNRSIALASLIAHLPPQFDYVSLQKEVRDADQAVLAGFPGIRHVGEELADFSDTAALCQLMDLVISVDTSVAHLAGSMGRPTWILLPRLPDWRWMLDRDDSPWYSSVKLYRQQVDGDWRGALERLRADLEAFDRTDR